MVPHWVLAPGFESAGCKKGLKHKAGSQAAVSALPPSSIEVPTEDSLEWIAPSAPTAEAVMPPGPISTHHDYYTLLHITEHITIIEPVILARVLDISKFIYNTHRFLLTTIQQMSLY